MSEIIRRTQRILYALSVWAHLAAFGLFLGVLALLRNLDRKGPGSRWRPAHLSTRELDDCLDRSAEPPPGPTFLAEEKRPEG